MLHPFVGNLAPWCRRSTSCLMIAAAIAVVAALSLNAGATSITGAKIAFTSNRSGTVQIHLMNADGSDVTPLTHPPGHSAYPAFSPDGRKIAFMSDRGGSDQIYIMNADGSKAVQITHLKGTFDRPRFSADGRRIAFTFIGRPGSPDTTSQIISSTRMAQIPDRSRMSDTSAMALLSAEMGAGWLLPVSTAL